jgi:hypothetical protein
MIISKLGINFVVPDQIPRLLCNKSFRIELAKKNLGYSPRILEEGIKNTIT